MGVRKNRLPGIDLARGLKNLSPIHHKYKTSRLISIPLCRKPTSQLISTAMVPQDTLRCALPAEIR